MNNTFSRLFSLTEGLLKLALYAVCNTGIYFVHTASTAVPVAVWSGAHTGAVRGNLIVPSEWL